MPAACSSFFFISFAPEIKHENESLGGNGFFSMLSYFFRLFFSSGMSCIKEWFRYKWELKLFGQTQGLLLLPTQLS